MYKCPKCLKKFFSKHSFLTHARTDHAYVDDHYHKIYEAPYEDEDHDSFALGLALGSAVTSSTPDDFGPVAAISEAAPSFEGGGGESGGGGATTDFSSDADASGSSSGSEASGSNGSGSDGGGGSDA